MTVPRPVRHRPNRVGEPLVHLLVDLVVLVLLGRSGFHARGSLDHMSNGLVDAFVLAGPHCGQNRTTEEWGVAVFAADNGQARNVRVQLEPEL